jgi:hypothetical protein
LCAGPIEFDINTYTGGLPRLVHYPYAWTKVQNTAFFTPTHLLSPFFLYKSH